ncbi:MAG: hypothetical protein K9H64_17950 [Bacteroidales bacterium]|nr:hypothetical protein [Bacteroidales bacterium]MCF8457927.1 hypothetical protein [Bacteroidales bacterium]
MRIANPIYDVVFKYLMDDNRVAKLMISKIIGEEIESLEFQPQEQSVKVDRPTKKPDKAKASFTVYRLDFAAKIKTPDGHYRQVLIEIQKAKFPTDIMRFRRYLGQQYQSAKNIVDVETKKRKSAIPIVTIYFLGHKLDFINAPVIKVNRTYIDLATGENLVTKEEFIESLTHNSFVIQIPYLKDNRRNELEKLLSVFDQSLKESDHILNINEKDYPDKFSDIIRKLQKAMVDEEVQMTMEIEDEILAELEEKEREIESLAESLAKNKALLSEKDSKLFEKDSMLSEKDSMLLEKDSMLSQKDSMLSEKDNMLSEKDKEIAELKRLLGRK